jgi:two-component system, NarL family, response regulator NreC
MAKLRILLADDHKVMREGLHMLINVQTDMEVVGEADNGRAAVWLAQQLQPDLVVLDISMPERNGLQAAEELQQLCPGTRILTLTRHLDRGYLQHLLQAGASGYVLKQSASEELVRAARAVAAGQTYIDPALTEQWVGHLTGRRSVAGAAGAKPLTAREEEVLRLVAWGCLSKEIAERLQISIKTVEAHKGNAMHKLGLKSRIDVVRYALLQGWLQTSEI